MKKYIISSSEMNDETVKFLDCLRRGDYEMMKLLLFNDDIDINSSTPGGFTALHLACYHYDIEEINVIEHLLKRFTNIDASDTLGINALRIACKLGDIYLVDELLNYGANINGEYRFDTLLRDVYYGGYEPERHNAELPIIIACSEMNYNIVIFLVERGANIHVKNYKGEDLIDLLPEDIRDKCLKISSKNIKRAK